MRPGSRQSAVSNLFNNDYSVVHCYFILVPVIGLEPTTPSLRMRCSTN